MKGIVFCEFLEMVRSHYGFDVVDQIKDHIHRAVRKFYPDAELPTITTTTDPHDRAMRLCYRSCRRLQDFARGMIEGTLNHYGERAEIAVEPQPDGTEGCLFSIMRTHP